MKYLIERELHERTFWALKPGFVLRERRLKFDEGYMPLIEAREDPFEQGSLILYRDEERERLFEVCGAECVPHIETPNGFCFERLWKSLVWMGVEHHDCELLSRRHIDHVGALIRHTETYLELEGTLNIPSIKALLEEEGFGLALGIAV